MSELEQLAAAIEQRAKAIAAGATLEETRALAAEGAGLAARLSALRQSCAAELGRLEQLRRLLQLQAPPRPVRFDYLG